MTQKNQINFYSMLTALVLLIYVLSYFSQTRLEALHFQIGGIHFNFSLKIIDLIAPIAALVAVSGFWMSIQDRFEGLNPLHFSHILAPSGVALILGAALRNTNNAVGWWGILFIGGFLLFAIFWAENVNYGPDVANRPIAQLFITGIVFAIYFIGMAAIRGNFTRLFMEVPITFLFSGLFIFRLFSLWVVPVNRFLFLCAVGIAGFMGQFVAILHYWPVNVLTFATLTGGFFEIIVLCVIWRANGTELRKVTFRLAPIAFIFLVASLLFHIFL